MRPGALMNLIELVTAVTTAFLFVYLLWALLRPEDF
jgi:K+-transporting ATPase KdpF subunit